MYLRGGKSYIWYLFNIRRDLSLFRNIKCRGEENLKKKLTKTDKIICKWDKRVDI
jgi:hypothetical protein